eukprot:TRINITY_DN360_c0_g1_i3.p1 TRINITY_DN360_c0_g1~~TRINITY_DN360_c0_g1_i3.p1  ORF type:complete len:100 (+),score=13.08 TRINITY_DN360_c0_g1_i3:806-1105(+)
MMQTAHVICMSVSLHTHNGYTYLKNSQSSLEWLEELDVAAVGSKVSHFVITNTEFFGCCCALLGMAFLILSKSSVSTYFCTLLTCTNTKAPKQIERFLE